MIRCGQITFEAPLHHTLMSAVLRCDCAALRRACDTCSFCARRIPDVKWCCATRKPSVTQETLLRQTLPLARVGAGEHNTALASPRRCAAMAGRLGALPQAAGQAVGSQRCSSFTGAQLQPPRACGRRSAQRSLSVQAVAAPPSPVEDIRETAARLGALRQHKLDRELRWAAAAPLCEDAVL